MTDHANQTVLGLAAANRPPWGNRLRQYFGSGWAFLTPYLAAYLIYAWLQWPVNAVDNTGASSLLRPPCLLHVYWLMHGMHLLLGSIALRAWWRDSAARHAPLHPPLNRNFRLQNAAPWVCLALLFYVPGVYLEFPSDPWQHFARLNEWSWLQTVTEHSFWKKSSYFLAYSLVGPITPPVLQLKGFDVFYTGCCLLLCWQYYRLARAIGLGARGGMFFVLLQAVLSGNFIFGFYRYYGMSSSVFAQIGAVALIRVALDAFGNNPGTERSENFGSSTLPRVLKLLGALVLLLILTGFNHVQGLGIAGLGVAAVIGWRLIQWRRSAAWWLAGAVIVLSVAAILWYPKHPALDASYRTSGWLTAWYGFNLLAPSSPAYGRAAAILGFFGLINLVAGAVLLRRNHVVGWLTVLPVAALCLPCVAIPFATSLAARPITSGEDIIVFSRMLFAIPSGLALTVLLTGWERKSMQRVETPPLASRPPFIPFACFLVGLFALAVVPASGRYYNRLHSVLMVPADDLAMRHVIQSRTVASLAPQPRVDDLIANPEGVFLERGGILTTSGIGYVMNATGATTIVRARKMLAAPPSQLITTKLEALRRADPDQVRDLPFPARENLFSATSQSGYLSTHWLPNVVALEHAAQGELFAHQSNFAGSPSLPQIWLEWSGPGMKQQMPAKGFRVSVASRAPEDRGRLDSGVGDQLIRVGDLLRFRPIMRTLDGDGWHLGLKVRGPGMDSRREFRGRPTPLKLESGIMGAHETRVLQPGEYTVELTGSVFWPAQTYVVRYHFSVQPDPR